MPSQRIQRTMAFCAVIVAPYLLLSTAAGIVAGWRLIAANEFRAQGFHYLAVCTVAEQVSRDFGFALLSSAVLAGIAALLVRRVRLSRVLPFVYAAQACLLASRFLYSEFWAISMPAFGLPLPGFLWRRSVVLWTAITLLALYAALGLILWLLRHRPATDLNPERYLRVCLAAALVSAGAVAAVDVTALLHAPRSPDRPRNVIWISWDSTRADHVGAYGYERPTTPNVDAFAADSVLFRYAISQHNWTKPSYASMFTSISAWELPNHIPELHHITLAEILRDYGYRTIAFVQNPNLDAEFHLNQGFQSHSQLPGSTPPPEMNRYALKALREAANSGEPFFLFLHIQEPHYPYPEDNPFRDQFLGDRLPAMDAAEVNEVMSGHGRGWRPDAAERDEKVRYLLDCYDADIRWADEGFGEIAGELKDLGLLEDSLVVFNSDHGDEFDDRGTFGHGHGNLNQELVFVPFVIRFPKTLAVAPTIVDTPVRSLDIFPTVLEVLGIPVPDQISGRPLYPLPAPGESVGLAFSWAGDLLAVRDERRSLILGYGGNTSSRLYDFRNDPRELSPLTETVPSTEVGTLQASADQWLNRYGSARSPDTGKPAVSRELLERLRNLGYIH